MCECVCMRVCPVLFGENEKGRNKPSILSLHLTCQDSTYSRCQWRDKPLGVGECCGTADSSLPAPVQVCCVTVTLPWRTEEDFSGSVLIKGLNTKSAFFMLVIPCLEKNLKK